MDFTTRRNRNRAQNLQILQRTCCRTVDKGEPPSKILRNATGSKSVPIPKEDVHKSIFDIKKAYDDMHESNETLKKKLRENENEIGLMKKSHGQQLAASEGRFQSLLKLKDELEKKVKDLEMNRGELIQNEIKKLTEENQQKMKMLIAKKDTEQQQALVDAKNQYSALIDEAKKTKYCVGCGQSQSIDIYVCKVLTKPPNNRIKNLSRCMR